MMDYVSYYSRKEIQQEIISISNNREVSYKLGEKGFGKRPDVLQFNSDIEELAKTGATSIHLSEELWNNPLLLKTGLTKKELDSLRIGWDLIFDIDSLALDYSKIAADIIVDALLFNDINNISVKFSGNRGFHIALPFRSFPPKINNLKTELLFPEVPKMIISYMNNLIKEPLSAAILEKFSIKEIDETHNIEKNKLIINDKFNPFSILDIDTMMISSRHMFRAPYSLHEKTNLVSLPINYKDIKNFNPETAKPGLIKPKIRFLDPLNVNEGEAKKLVIQAYDRTKRIKPELIKPQKIDFKALESSINPDFFPPCIKLILNGVKSDGRKRSLFILINFLRNTGYSLKDIEKILNEWNKKNYNPLKEGYIQSQLSWNKNKTPIMPPNCDNSAYYQELNICHSDNFCKKIKNPVNYSTLKSKLMKFKTTKK